MDVEWLNSYGFMDESFSLVKNGRPPQPVWVPKAGRYGGDLRTLKSYKMGRDFNLCYPLEFYHFLMLDCDPLVKWICERPEHVDLKIDGKKVSTTFDMWVLWHDGREEMREVKPDDKTNTDQAKRQKRAQEAWCNLVGLPHRQLTDKHICVQPLQTNCRQMHPYLAQNPGCEWEHKVLAAVDHAKVLPLQKLVGSTYLETQKLVHAAMHLIWRGELFAPLNTLPWKKLTLERLSDVRRLEPFC